MGAALEIARSSGNPPTGVEAAVVSGEAVPPATEVFLPHGEGKDARDQAARDPQASFAWKLGSPALEGFRAGAEAGRVTPQLIVPGTSTLKET